MDARYNTLFIGKVLKVYDILDSTNSEAERLLQKNKIPEGSIVYAKKQNKGRGQMGSQWLSGAGLNLTISLILYPKIDFPKEQFLLNQIISLGIRDCLDILELKNVSIKWPNDIYINDKKISGILIQNSISGKKISHSIIGIGLNVNQSGFEYGAGNPTSIFIEKGKTFELDKVLEILCSTLEKRYLMLKSGKQELLKEEYYKYLYRKDLLSEFKKKDGSLFQGIIRGIGPEGKLIVENKGVMESFYFKEISFA